MDYPEIVEFLRKLRGRDSAYLGWGPRMADMAHHSIDVLRVNPECGLTDIPRLVQDGAYRDQLLKQVSEATVLEYWESFGSQSARVQREWSEAFLNRVRGLLRESY